jgi:hypothetical protein
MLPVVHDSLTSMSLHFRSLVTLLEKPGVSPNAKKKILLEMSETLLLNTNLKFPSSFVRTIIDKLEGNVNRVYIDRLWLLV